MQVNNLSGQIDSLNDETIGKIYREYLGSVHYALVYVLHKDEEEAHRHISEAGKRFIGAPRRELEMLLHNDPVAFACEITGTPWSNVDPEMLKMYHNSNQDTLQSP